LIKPLDGHQPHRDSRAIGVRDAFLFEVAGN
jgi:hypothetical protein